jgi:LPXTG-motif cell wall-anchored protein
MTGGSGQGLDGVSDASVVGRVGIGPVKVAGITAVLAGIMLVGLIPVPAGRTFVGLIIPRVAGTDDSSARSGIGSGPATTTPTPSMTTSPTTGLVAPPAGGSDSALPDESPLPNQAAVPPEQIIGSGASGTTVRGAGRPGAAQVTKLPVTGTDVASTVTLGTSLIIGGLLLLAVRRRQPRPARPRPTDDDIRRPTVLRRR